MWVNQIKRVWAVGCFCVIFKGQNLGTIPKSCPFFKYKKLSHCQTMSHYYSVRHICKDTDISNQRD